MLYKNNARNCKMFLLAFLLLGTASAQRVSVTRTNEVGKTFAPGDIIFQDEFNSDLDLSKWHHEINMNGGYNGEFQIYDKYSENAFTRDGILYIRPTMSIDTIFKWNYEELYNGYIELDGCTDGDRANCFHQGYYPWINPPVVSGRLRTLGTFGFTYGRVEARAKLPSADWTWPAIWMLPDDSVYGQWPRSGEIDIMESRGNRKLFNDQGVNIGIEQTASTLHFGPQEDRNGFMKTHGEFNTPQDQGFDRDFHIYTCEWTPSSMVFKVDNDVVSSTYPPGGGFWELGQFANDVPNPWNNAPNRVMAPFDQNFHLILNVATGGMYFPPNSVPAPPWGETAFLDFLSVQSTWNGSWSYENAAMAIDYIRVYAV